MESIFGNWQEWIGFYNEKVNIQAQINNIFVPVYFIVFLFY